MNIVFDIGGVVLHWDPKELIAKVIPDEKYYDAIWEGIFKHRDWEELDRGTLEEAEAVNRFAERTGTELHKIKMFMKLVPISLTPMEETINLMYNLREQGHTLYCLSNMHINSMNYIKKAYSFWEVFEGEVFSCLLHTIKPEKRIFRHLLEKYHLKAGETVFIDDTEKNVRACEMVGIKGIHFTSARECEKEIKRISI